MLSGFFVIKKDKNLLAKTHDGAHIKLTRAEIGIYALDPDEGEILYLYGNTSATGDKPDEIKSESEAPLEYLFNLNLSFEDGTEVEVDVNNGILYVTKQELIDMADNKVDKVAGKGLSPNDYTAAEKTKLAGITAGANNYVHPSTHPSTMITGMGTAATKNTGTTAANIPLIEYFFGIPMA